MTANKAAVEHSREPSSIDAPTMGRITEDEVARFKRDGCLVVPRAIISSPDIDEARKLIEGILSRLNKVPRIFVNDMGKSVGFKGRKPRLMPNVLFPADVERALRRTEAYKTCRRVAEQIFGGPVRYEFDQVILKNPHSNATTPWHTDLGYKRHPESCPESIDFWIAMQDTSREMGAMRYIPGSHLESIEHDRVGGPSGHLVEARDIDESRALEAPLPKGGIGIHHLRTLHSAGPNVTDLPRLSWIIHFPPEDRKRFRRWAEDKHYIDSYIRLNTARLVPLFGPLLVRVEKLLLRRKITM
jgi:hypothetical protein